MKTPEKLLADAPDEYNALLHKKEQWYGLINNNVFHRQTIHLAPQMFPLKWDINEIRKSINSNGMDDYSIDDFRLVRIGLSIHTGVVKPSKGLGNQKFDNIGGYVDNPELDNPEDIYYSGCGCTWGIDKNEHRYWKLFSGKDHELYPHLDPGDIINNEARMKKLIIKVLDELDLLKEHN